MPIMHYVYLYEGNMRYLCGRLLGSCQVGRTLVSACPVICKRNIVTLPGVLESLNCSTKKPLVESTHNSCLQTCIQNCNGCTKMFHTCHSLQKKKKLSHTLQPHTGRGKYPSDFEIKMPHSYISAIDEKSEARSDGHWARKSPVEVGSAVTNGSLSFNKTKSSKSNQPDSIEGLDNGDTDGLHAEFQEYIRIRKLGSNTVIRDGYQCNFLVFKTIHALTRLIDSSGVQTVDLEDFLSDDSVKREPLVNDKHWDDLYSAFRRKCYFLQSTYINVVLWCIAFKGRPELAVSFMKYMRRHCVPDTSEMARLASICAKDYPKFACEVYDRFIADKKLSNYTVKLLINGFAASTKWEMCFDWIDWLERDSSGLYLKPILPLLRRLFLENDLDTVYTTYMRANNEDSGILKVLDFRNHMFHWWSEGEISTEAMLDVACKCNVIFDQRRAMELVSCFNGESERPKPAEKLKIKVALVRNEGCTSCSRNIPQDCVTHEQFDRLKRQFASVFVTKAQIYRHTSPDEFRQYLDLLKRLPKIDVVVDIPNVVFPDPNRDRVMSVLQQLRRLGKTVLAVGTTKDTFFSLQKDYPDGVYMYKAPYGSPDDLFTLMSALHFGIDTMVFSNDKFRSYRKHLDAEMQQVFVLWQKCRQITHLLKSDVFHLPYNTVPNKHDGGWHLPFYSSDLPLSIRELSFNTTTSVLCITKEK